MDSFFISPFLFIPNSKIFISDSLLKFAKLIGNPIKLLKLPVDDWIFFLSFNIKERASFILVLPTLPVIPTIFPLICSLEYEAS